MNTPKRRAKRTETARHGESATETAQDMGPTPQAPGRPIQVPSKVTLRKYGLDAQAWLAILEAQGWTCAICKKVPKTGRFVTDHHHAKGWKKMKPEKRRLYVRGLTCWWCNKNYIGRSISVEKASNVVLYLRAFQARLEAM